MLKTILLSASLVGVITTSSAQAKTNLGIGYFGQTLTHPGIVLELEKEKCYTGKASLPLRLNLGYYVHPRYHNGFFMDVSYGFRRYFKSGFFMEESIGMGLLATVLNADGVYEVDDNGKVTETGRWNPPDAMPSVTLGMGYKFSNELKIWMRPKIYWQFPHKNSSTYYPVLQLGIGLKVGK